MNVVADALLDTTQKELTKYQCPRNVYVFIIR